MFDCPYCSSKTSKLIGTKLGIRCSKCYELVTIRNTHLHDKGPWGKMTWGKAGVIDNRVTSRDDGVTVIDRRTGKETEY